MTTTVVRYRIRTDRADDNEALIVAVFAELAEQQPEGLRYTVYRLADDTYVHIVDTDDGTADTGLTSLPTFGQFVEGIDERSAVAPTAHPAVPIGSYRHTDELRHG